MQGAFSSSRIGPASHFPASIETAPRAPDLLPALGQLTAAMGFVCLRTVDGHIAPRLFKRTRLLLLSRGDRLVMGFSRMIQTHGVILPIKFLETSSGTDHSRTLLKVREIACPQVQFEAGTTGIVASCLLRFAAARQSA
jgi:hypothetical protein